MAERTYLIAVDTRDAEMDPEAVKSFIRTSPFITNWWNYIPMVFIVVSSRSADELSEQLRPYAGSAGHLVIEVNAAHSEGWLPERAWRWIKRHSSASADAPVAAE